MDWIKYAIKLIVVSIFISLSSFAQSIKVTTYPDLKPLADANIALDKKNIGTTNIDGLYHIREIGAEITLSFLGYITQIFPKPQRDTSILMLPASILLAEVIISPPREKIKGYFGKWGNGITYGKPDFNSSIVNSITITEITKLKSFLFYIPNFQNSQINIPFEFVIFKEVNGQYLTTTLVNPIGIEQYDFLWNSFSLTPYNLSLEPGNYLFGMKWIKSKVNESRENSSIRQPLGTINKGATDVSSYRSTPNKGWQLLANNKDGVTNFTIALLGLIIDK